MTHQRFQRVVATLNRRQPDLTVLMEQVHKPHNLSAIIRTCDAVGVGEVHAIAGEQGFRASTSVTQGTHKWVSVHRHSDCDIAFACLKQRGFRIYAAHFSDRAVDFRAPDYTQPTAVLLGTERFGVSAAAAAAADGHIIIPMQGMAQSLNVSVACALILYEAQRQRQAAGLYDHRRLEDRDYTRLLFEWCYPRVASLYRRQGIDYPSLARDGEITGVPTRG